MYFGTLIITTSYFGAGCDGLSSEVKSSLPELRSSSIYSGLRILYSVSEPYEWKGGGAAEGLGRKKELRQFFGEGCYQLKGTYGYDSEKVCDMSAIVYKGNKRGENTAWEKEDLYEDFVRRSKLVGGSREEAANEKSSKFIEVRVCVCACVGVWEEGGGRRIRFCSNSNTNTARGLLSQPVQQVVERLQ